ncbi:MAG: hypothetical protein ACO3LT_08075 [Ilumatobacteraceae bacterium]
MSELRRRCSERGHDIAGAIACIVEHHADGTITVDHTHPAYPHPRKGLGDRVADGLAAVGITKERVSKLVGKDCGCKKRQEALNRLGQRAAEAVRKLTGQDATDATPEEQKRPMDD